MKKYTPYALSALLALWAAVCFGYFAACYPHHLFYQEQMQLFVLSPDYLITYFARPAWLACMTGDFLTQFFYYLYAGPALLTVVLLTLGDVTRRVLQRVNAPTAVAYGVAFVVMTLEAVGYLHYDTRLSGTLALAGGLAMFLLDTFLISRGTKMRHRVTSATDRLPLALRTLIFTLGQFLCLALTYWMWGCGVIPFALFLIYKYYRVEVGLAIVGCVALILLLQPVYYLPVKDLFRYPGQPHLTLPQTLLERDFAAADLYHFGRWEELKAEIEAQPDTALTQQQLFYYYLVQAQQGALPESLLRGPSPYLGTFEEIGPQTPLLTIRRMPELYWALGDMTFAERAAMQALVFTPTNRNARTVKRLAEVNLVTGHEAAADKYLRMLSRTVAYRRWAQRLLARNEAAMAPYRRKAEWMNRTDTLRTTDQCHLLLTQLLDSNPDNYVARDYMLCSDLLLGDIPSFHRDYQRYCVDAHCPSPHRLYHEALCVWLAGNEATEEEWLDAGIPQDVLREFAAYNRQRGDARFKGTYWYYFDRMKKKNKRINL
jgi:hypothetical protein